MLEAIKKNKYTIGGIAILLVGFLIYNVYFTGPADEAAEPDVSAEASADQIGGDVASLLRKLKAVDLDGAIFEDPAFRSLRPFGYSIREREFGRSNPFGPIGPGPSDKGLIRDSVSALE